MSTVRRELEEAAARLPAAAVPYLVQMIGDALASSDPVDYIARRAQADAAHAAAQKTVETILGG